MDFLWHKVSEKEKKEIKEQAKSILDNFSSKLSEINKNVAEPIIERNEFERIEETGKCGDEDFRKIMFENALTKNNDFIIGEKKSW